MTAVFLSITPKPKRLWTLQNPSGFRVKFPLPAQNDKTLRSKIILSVFFERELEVKLTRREMWRSVRFVASLFVLLLALSTGEPLPVLPALALAAYAYRGVADITSRFTEKGGAR